MVQAAGDVNIVVKNLIGFNKKGVWTSGDNSTAHDVTPREAIDIIMSDSHKTTTDVKWNPADLKQLLTPANEPTNAANTTQP